MIWSRSERKTSGWSCKPQIIGVISWRDIISIDLEKNEEMKNIQRETNCYFSTNDSTIKKHDAIS